MRPMMGWYWYLPRCNRCGERSWTLMISMFNTQRCCSSCIDREKKLSSYGGVRDRVMMELGKGTNKFPVINIGRGRRGEAIDKYKQRCTDY